MPSEKNDPAETVAERLAAHSGLPPLHQAIVHVLAVIGTPTVRTNILTCLKKIFSHDDEIKRFRAGELDGPLQALADLELARGDGRHFVCNPTIREPVCRALAAAGRFDGIAAAVQSVLGEDPYFAELYHIDYDQLVRELRIGLYRGDFDTVREMMALYEKYHAADADSMDPLAYTFRNGFDTWWVAENLPRDLQLEFAASLVGNLLYHALPLHPNDFDFFAACAADMDEGDYVRGILECCLAEHLVLRGDFEEAKRRTPSFGPLGASLAKGWLAVIEGRYGEAVSLYETALKQTRRRIGKRKIFFVNRSGLFFILALVKSGTPQHLKNAMAHTLVEILNASFGCHTPGLALKQLIEHRRGLPEAFEPSGTRALSPSLEDPISSLVTFLAVYWIDPKRAAEAGENVRELHARAESNGHEWLMAELSVLLSRLFPRESEPAEKTLFFFRDRNIPSLVDLIAPQSKWRRSLEALINLEKRKAGPGGGGKSYRLVWLFDYDPQYGVWEIAPRQQALSPKGEWSKGRKIALKRLYREIDTFDFVTPQDRAVCACIDEERSYRHGYPDVDYDFSEKALSALAGHPLVFLFDSPRTPVELVKCRPEVLADQLDNGDFELTVSPHIDPEDGVRIIPESPTRFRIVETDDDIDRIARIVGSGIVIPAAGKSKLLEAMDSVAAMVTIQSQIADTGGQAEKTAADPTPNIHLRPLGRGLKVDLVVRPFSRGGPCFRPGEGKETILSDIDGHRFSTRRALEEEMRLAEKVVEGCPTLAAAGDAAEGTWGWELHHPPDCLETLLEMRELETPVSIHWPEGESFKIRQQADINRFFVNVKKRGDWFSVTGELKLDDGLVLSMEKLLSLLEASEGRFVRLESGEFLALTREFRKRLEAWAAYSKKSGGSRRFHPLAALSLEESADEMGGIDGDSHWKAHIRKREAAGAFQPRVPSTFRADLRDYQLEGFTWLARMAHWGVGACLADDMGLGKTVQALAVILTKAAEGPSLVVAPTSVCMNWHGEAERFAPTLNRVDLNTPDREKAVKDLKPFDLLVVSYGLLQRENVADLLSGTRFQTIVLDEAQAIKNLSTKRSRAAMNLRGAFRLITTGTPVENNLGELWNLFRFINPGFLGSFREFNAAFAVPIEKNRDRNARNRLKALVRPFVLRRTKSQVLDELPRRTDILLPLELSRDETAFYEALRRKALARLSAAGGDTKSKHLKILAEIMKLRRACCNARLVVPDLDLPSTKLNAFGEIAEEILSGGHKALVFSQFTGHLAILRRYVEDRGIAYQYLDGGTSQKERRKRVNAFQRGEGDLFLISLKAGGLGLNLTAADYVVHMDPWWNPAVEDQASDRAHRIGQERPVTVYRLVTRHTIEEKIVDLHRSKRDLADSLLEGADMSGRMTPEALLRLIAGR